MKITIKYSSSQMIDLGLTIDKKGRTQLAGHKFIERDENGNITKIEYLPPAVKFVYDDD